MLWDVGSFEKVWAKTFGGITVRKINQEKKRIANHGEGLS